MVMRWTYDGSQAMHFAIGADDRGWGDPTSYIAVSYNGSTTADRPPATDNAIFIGTNF